MDPRVVWAIRTMEQGMGQPLRIADLARGTNLSVSRFAHLFRYETGMAPRKYLHILRMRRASILLERTFLSVKEVMAQVGISDPSHFARDFRRVHGLSPLGLRRRLRKAAPVLLLSHLIALSAAAPNGAHPAGRQQDSLTLARNGQDAA